jgi:hypothetical protein
MNVSKRAAERNALDGMREERVIGKRPLGHTTPFLKHYHGVWTVVGKALSIGKAGPEGEKRAGGT